MSNSLEFRTIWQDKISSAKVVIHGLGRNGSFKWKDESNNSQFSASDLSSFSSSDLSSMIAAWVDQNSCCEYEKELKVSSGIGFRTIAMKQYVSEQSQKEHSGVHADKCFRVPIDRPIHSLNQGSILYESCRDTNEDESAVQRDCWRSPKRSCAQSTDQVPKISR